MKDMKCAVLALGAAAAFKLLTLRGGRPRPDGVAAVPKVRARALLEHTLCRSRLSPQVVVCNLSSDSARAAIAGCTLSKDGWVSDAAGTPVVFVARVDGFLSPPSLLYRHSRFSHSLPIPARGDAFALLQDRLSTLAGQAVQLLTGNQPTLLLGIHTPEECPPPSAWRVKVLSRKTVVANDTLLVRQYQDARVAFEVCVYSTPSGPRVKAWLNRVLV